MRFRALVFALLFGCGGGSSGVPDNESATESLDVAPPRFYFVLHADPAVGPGLQTSWSRLTEFMAMLEDRNSNLARPHRVTILFSPTWGSLISGDSGRVTTVGQWIAAGHEMGFHSHTSNHAKRDGFSNVSEWQRDDASPGTESMCREQDCSLDHGLSLVQTALDAANGSAYDIRWARIGGEGNGGPECPAGVNDNSCDAETIAGEVVADCCGCVEREWTGMVNATVNYTTVGTIEYGEDPDDPDTLLTTSTCKTWGDEVIYGLAHAPYETESGWRVRTLETVEAAFQEASFGDHIGIVIHPGSFDAAATVGTVSRTTSCDGGSNPPASGDAPDKRSHIVALFEAAEAAGFESRTLSEVREAERSGGGEACRDLR